MLPTLFPSICLTDGVSLAFHALNNESVQSWELCALSAFNVPLKYECIRRKGLAVSVSLGGTVRASDQEHSDHADGQNGTSWLTASEITHSVRSLQILTITRFVGTSN